MINIDNAIAVLQAVKAGKTVRYTRMWKDKPPVVIGPSHHFDFDNNFYEIVEEEQRSSKPAPVAHYERVKPRVRTLPYGYIQNDAGRVFS